MNGTRPLLSEGWFSPSERVPRKDQPVRIANAAGATFEATFRVEHTRDWPSGAAWEHANGHSLLRFADVAAWSPEPYTTVPAFVPVLAAPPDPEEAEEPTIPLGAVVPALVRETTLEIERTGALLRLMPPDQLDWSPHPDLPTLRTLARRLIRTVARIRWILEIDTIETSFEPDLPPLESLEDLVETYQASAATAAEMTPRLSGSALREAWTLERNGEPLQRLERGEALREYGLRPLVYHQAEIALLLVSMGLPVPHPYPLWTFTEAPKPEPTSWAAPQSP